MVEGCKEKHEHGELESLTRPFFHLRTPFQYARAASIKSLCVTNNLFSKISSQFVGGTCTLHFTELSEPRTTGLGHLPGFVLIDEVLPLVFTLLSADSKPIKCCFGLELNFELLCFLSLPCKKIADVSNVYISFNVNEVDSPKPRQPPPKAPILNHHFFTRDRNICSSACNILNIQEDSDYAT